MTKKEELEALRSEILECKEELDNANCFNMGKIMHLNAQIHAKRERIFEILKLNKDQ